MRESRRMPARSLAPGFARDAGEFFVLAELTRRGWTAAAAAQNNRIYDILAKRGDEFAAIRVKTKTSAYTFFEWNAKPGGDVFLQMTQQRDFCVLVDIPEDGNAGPIYYVTPTPVVDKWLREDFQKWISTPRPGVPERRTASKRRILYVDDETEKLHHGYLRKLASYQGAWNLLFTHTK
jgi:hypothetical protein